MPMNVLECERVVKAYQRRPKTPYSCFKPGQLFVIQQQERAMLAALAAAGLDSDSLARARVFEVGCGDGGLLRRLLLWGADPARCAGADIRLEAVRNANRINSNLRIYHADCSQTDEPSSHYDIVLQNLVLSSVLRDDLRASLAREMVRITRPGGIILSCDLRYDNPRNADVKGVSKRQLLRLFRGCRLERCESVLLIPPIARRLARWSVTACNLLSWIPPLRGHCLAVFRRE